MNNRPRRINAREKRNNPNKNTFSKYITLKNGLISLAAAGIFAVTVYGISNSELFSSSDLEIELDTTEQTDSELLSSSELESELDTTELTISTREGRIYQGSQDLELIAKNSPLISSALENGVILSLEFDPSVTDLLYRHRPYLEDKFSERGMDNLESQLLESEKVYNDKFHNVTIYPTNTLTYGLQIPEYVIVPSDFFTNEISTNEDEALLIFEHEAQHANDFYYGVSYNNGLEIVGDDLRAEKNSIEFFTALIEYRAYYFELDKIFKNKVGLESLDYTDFFISHEAGLYIESYEKMFLNVRTESDAEILEAQLSDFGGITTERITENKFKIHFDLYGFQNFLSVNLLYD